jgi:diguanylate cyclase (GGDEF)-like protein/PAS domain S-box-containing protein
VVIRQLAAFADNDRLLSELGRHEKRFRALLRHSTDITTITRTDGTVSYVSPAIERILGLPVNQVVGTAWLDRVHPDDVATAQVMFTAPPERTVAFQARFRHADGTWRWLDMFSTNLVDEPGVHGVVSNARDITDARLLQDQMRHQAHHDPLTGLANRALFTECLNAAVEGADRFVVYLIDLDDFKPINDTLGHHAGDAVLVAVSERLRAGFREQDVPARLGGDEFAVLVRGADDGLYAGLETRFRDLLAEPVEVDGQLIAVRASIGSVIGDATTADEILRRADDAMYRAKRAAKKSVRTLVP